MDAKTFLDNFGTISDAPEGVDRLRELILDLAVRGQLTQQDPEDGNVDEQVSAIAGVVQPSTLVDPITDRAIPWDIPATWRWVRFKQIVDFAPGKTPSTKDSSYWEEPELGELWASISDMPDSGTLFTTGRAITQKAVTTVMKRPPAPVGALLMSFKLTIGKVCRVGRPTYFNEAIIEIDTPREVTKEFLFRTLPLLALGGSSKAAIKGNTLNKGSITNIPIPFPPLGEQERIVAKVDELMQLCDDLEARQQARHHVTARLRASALDALTSADTDDDLHTAWSRIHTNWEAITEEPDCIEPLRQTILRLAVQGKLVEQRDDEGSATDLVVRLGDDRRQRGLRAAMNVAGEPQFSIPATWAWTSFGFVTDTRLGKMLDKAKNSGPHRPYLRNINVQWFRFKLDDVAELRLEDSEYPEYELRFGDLLICEGGEPGRSAVCDDSVAGLVFQKALHRARPLLGIDPWYLAFLLRSYAGSGLLARYFTGATIKHLTGQSLARLPVPLPPVEEQRRIVDRVLQLMRLCEDLEACLASRTRSHETLGAALTAAAAS